MTIKIHLFFSFLIHSLMLTYFLSLPIYKNSLDAVSFEGFFVSLRSEEGRVSGETSLKGEGERSVGKKQGGQKEDAGTVLMASQGRKETSKEALKEKEIEKSEPELETGKISTEEKQGKVPEDEKGGGGIKVKTGSEESSSKEKVVEIVRHGVIEQKVFVSQDAPEEKHFSVEQRKGTDEPREDEQAEVDVPGGLYEQKDLVDTGEPLEDGVAVYEGTILKTVPGFTIIPYEDASRVEILHARREEKTETKEDYEVEVLGEQKELSKEEVEKDKNKEHVEVVEVRKKETPEKEIKESEPVEEGEFRGRGLLSNEATVTVSSDEEKPEEDFEILREAEPEEEVFANEEADVDLIEDEHTTNKTVRTGPLPIIEKGLLIETLQGRMMIPLEETLSGEPLPVEKQAETWTQMEIETNEKAEVEQLAETKAREQVKIETETRTQIEKEIGTETYKKTQLQTQIEAETEAEEEEEMVLEIEKEIQEEVEVKVEVEQLEKAKEQAKVETEDQIETKAKEQVEAKKQAQTQTEIETEIETKAQTKGSEETNLPRIIYFHTETKRESLVKTDKGFLLETIPETMTMPFEIEPSWEAVNAENREVMEQTAEKDLESHKKEKEPVEEYVEAEVPFDRLRVEEKLRYLESSTKGKKKKITKKELFIEEHKQEMITEKMPVPIEGPEEPLPVLEIAKLSKELASPETIQDEEGKGTDSEEEVDDKQLSEEQSVKKIVAPDIPEIDTGLLLTSVPVETTVPFKEDLKMDLSEEKSGGREDEKESEDTEQKSLTEHEANKLETEKYPDLLLKEDDYNREIEKGTGDEKKSSKMEETTAEYYKEDAVMPKASPFFEKLQEDEEKEAEIQEKFKVEVEEQTKAEVKVETEEQAEEKAQEHEQAQIESQKEIEIENQIEIEKQVEKQKEKETGTQTQIEIETDKETKAKAEVNVEAETQIEIEKQVEKQKEEETETVTQTQAQMETEKEAKAKEQAKGETEADEILSEPLIERIIDSPFDVETGRSEESHQEQIPQGFSEIEDKESVVADGVAPESSRVPSREEYTKGFGEKQELMTAGIRPESRESIEDGEKKPSLGISIPDVFFKKDIKIEISMNDPETTDVLFQLMKKAHPLDEKGSSLNQEEIKLVEDTSINYTLEYKRVFSTAKADKGIYIFMIKNNASQGYEADVLFHIFEGKSGERKKEYKTVELPPNTTLKYKFIIPEAVFWDDEGYFTGTIESSDTMTKFNEKTGLIWQEEKDN